MGPDGESLVGQWAIAKGVREEGLLTDGTGINPHGATEARALARSSTASLAYSAATALYTASTTHWRRFAVVRGGAAACELPGRVRLGGRGRGSTGHALSQGDGIRWPDRSAYSCSGTWEPERLDGRDSPVTTYAARGQTTAASKCLAAGRRLTFRFKPLIFTTIFQNALRSHVAQRGHHHRTRRYDRSRDECDGAQSSIAVASTWLRRRRRLPD